MKVILFTADSIIKNIFNHFDKDKIHALTYYTKGHYLKLTWEFDNSKDRDKAIDWLSKFNAEVYPTDKDDKLFATIKFNEEFDVKKLESIFGTKGTEVYFANQPVIRFYL